MGTGGNEDGKKTLSPQASPSQPRVNEGPNLENSVLEISLTRVVESVCGGKGHTATRRSHSVILDAGDGTRCVTRRQDGLPLPLSGPEMSTAPVSIGPPWGGTRHIAVPSLLRMPRGSPEALGSTPSWSV